MSAVWIGQPSGSSARPKSRRKRPRISVDELNARGLDAIRDKAPGWLEDADTRSTFEKFFDWIDLPRNLVGNMIGSIAGVDKSKLSKGALGLRKVYMSDVLRKMGVKNKVVGGIAGFLGDVAIDPLTYLTAGASAGTQVARNAPKVLGSGMRAMGQFARHGGDDVIRAALGKAGNAKAMKRLMRMAAKHGGSKRVERALGKRIARNLTRADDAGDAARAFFTQHGLRGRPLFRVPFTELMGPVMPGRQKALYRAVSDPNLPKALQSLGRLEDAGKAAKGIQAFYRGSPVETRRGRKMLPYRLLKERAGQVQDIPGPGARIDKVRQLGTGGDDQLARAETIIRQLRARESQYGEAKGKLAEMYKSLAAKAQAADIPEAIRNAKHDKLSKIVNHAAFQRAGLTQQTPFLRMLQEGRWGKVYDPTKQPIRHALQQVFGMGRQGTAVQRELANVHRFGPGSDAALTRAFAAVRPKVDAAAEAMVKSGRFADAGEARAALAHLIDLTDEAGALKQTLAPDDAGRALFAQYGDLLHRPEVREAMDAYADAVGQRGFLHRTLSKEARPFVQAVDEPMGFPGKSSPGYKFPARKQPSQLNRTKMLEWQRPDGTTVRALDTSADAAKHHSRFGDPTSVFDISAAEMDRLAKLPADQAHSLAPVVGSEFAEAAAKKPMTFHTMDPAASAGAWAGQQERIGATRDIEAMVREHAVPVDLHVRKTGDLAKFGLKVPKNLPEGHPLRSLPIGRAFGLSEKQAIAYPRQVADMLDRFASMWTESSSISPLLKAVDTTMGAWKRFALMHPGYVIRNAWQNAFGTAMAGGNPFRAAKLAMGDAVKRIRRAIALGDEAALLMPDGKTPRTVRLLDGRNWSLRDLAQVAQQSNMIGGTRTTAEMAPAAMRGASGAARTGRGALRTGRTLLEGVQTVNETMEQSQRLGAWLQFVEKGLSPQDAAMRTLLAMPDMSNLTRFERTTLARVFPWARWMKANGALQLFHYLPQKPAWLASVPRVQNAIEEMAVGADRVPDELRADWMRDAQGAQITGDAEGGQSFLLRSFFPFEEAQGVATSLADPKEGARWALSSMRPELKFAVEAASGKDIFRQQDVETPTAGGLLRALPKAVFGQSGTSLDNLASVRPLREYGVRVPQQRGGTGRKVIRGVIGGAVQDMDSAKATVSIDFQTRAQVSKLKQQFWRAMEGNDRGRADGLLKLLVQTLHRRRLMGLPISKDDREFLEELVGSAL